MAVQNRDFTIIFEDKDIVVADKPAGLLSVPIPNSRAKNLFGLLLAYYERTGVVINTVHRIDRYTSGLMVFTKNEQAYDHLFNQFKNHQPVRRYLAVVRGLLDSDTGELNHYLRLVSEGFRNVAVEPDDEEATPARLTYKVRKRFLKTTMVEVCLDTGLKNQIRVQFEAIGHQLVGDQHYAAEEEEEPLINRQALHAWQLSFIHPTNGTKVDFTAPIPPDMLRLIDHYRWEQEMMGRI